MKIALIGASGNAGSQILAELSRRGHQITAIARHPEKIAALPGVTPVKGDVYDAKALAALLRGHDAVASAVHFTASDPQLLLDAVRAAGIKRYMVVGGAGSLEVAPGKKLIDQPDFPEAYKAEAAGGSTFLDMLRATTDLDWTFLSPSAMDHKDILGPTLADIAADKADAIRGPAPVCCAAQFPEAARVLENTAKAHADTPRLDFKQRPLVEQPGVAQAKTHYYGGIRKYQWLARPLALHGVIVRENGETLSVTIGEKPGEPVFCIADLLPHLAQKQVTQPVSEAFEAEKLNIILAHSTPKAKSGKEDDAPKDPIKTQLLELLHKKYGICEEDFVTAELQAVPAGPARFVGFDKAMIGGYGQDDRICVFTALEALLEAEATGRSMAVMFWDKEEIGSDGATGAASRFMQYCVEDLTRAWEKDVPPAHVLLETRALSADVSAALDPDYQDVHEKQNAALLGHGPVFSKFTGSRGKYGASEADAEFFGALRGLLNGKSIAWQAAELGKVDHARNPKGFGAFHKVAGHLLDAQTGKTDGGRHGKNDGGHHGADLADAEKGNGRNKIHKRWHGLHDVQNGHDHKPPPRRHGRQDAAGHAKHHGKQRGRKHQRKRADSGFPQAKVPQQGKTQHAPTTARAVQSLWTT